MTGEFFLESFQMLLDLATTYRFSIQMDLGHLEKVGHSFWVYDDKVKLATGTWTKLR